MKFFEIKHRLAPLIVFTLQDVYLADPNFRQATLYDWVKDGKVVQLKQNRYVFADREVHNHDVYLISNQIYQPSYISLELALNHYSVIPEAVQVITATTTRKTASFTNPLGTFGYQTIAPKLFFGYINLAHRHRFVQISTLEKSILDYLYLHPQTNSVEDFEALRWNQHILTEQLNWQLLNTYLVVFDNRALGNRVATLKTYLEG